MKQSKAYPYLRALLDALIEAAPNWAKAPGRFAASLSDQLESQGQEINKQLEQEITSISEDKLRAIVEEAGCKQEENIEFVVSKVRLIPDILQTFNYRFDKVDEKLEEIKRLLLPEQAPAPFPLEAGLHNQTPPEVHFVGREEMLDRITGWYKSSEVRVGALIGWGGVGKSALARKWYDSLEAKEIRPDGIFWWGFYRNAYLEQFLNALLRYVSGGQIEPDSIKSTWEKTERIKEHIHRGRYLIVLDGLEQMQKGESGDEFGKMLNPELTELLHYLTDGPKEEGLCLITTRYTMKDLDDWESSGYEKLPLIELSEPDAMLMLKNRGVKGSDEKKKEVIKRYKGHALSLTSLAGYLDRYYDGDIEQAPDVKFVLDDEERFEDVNKLMRKYAEKMSEAEQVFLNIFSLFRQDITERDFAGVFRHRIKGRRFNKVLVKMSELDFRDLIGGLVDWRLVAYDETKKAYSTHPLIKGYFEADFAEKNKKLCHKRIYQYFGENAPEYPETLEEMQPLFEQVYYGCAAGLYDEVRSNVYYDKINRRNEFFLTQKMGAEEINLSLVKMFFPEGDLSRIPLVSKKGDQSWLFGVAGLALLNTGKPKEAEEPFLIGVKMEVEAKDWKNASAGYEALADLQFRTGELESGLESAKKDFNAAEKAKFDEYIESSKGYLGWILYLMGKVEEAEKDFNRADEIARKIFGHEDYSITEVFHIDFLISTRRIDEAYDLAKQNLEICENHKWTNSISRCRRCLGAIERIKGNYKLAAGHLQDALKGARKVGMPFLEIEALLESSRLQLDTERYGDAIRDANEVMKICGRTGFRFYEPGAEIILARAYLAQNDIKEAKDFAHSAYDKAVGMKYRWPEGNAGHLLGEVYLAEGDKVKARKWLKKAVVFRKEILDPNVEESEKMLESLG